MQLVSFLLESQADPNIPWKSPENEKATRSPLHTAAQLGDAQIVEILLKNGANFMEKDGKGLLASEYAETPELKKLFRDYTKPKKTVKESTLNKRKG